MNQDERLDYLIDYLIKEDEQLRQLDEAKESMDKRRLFRALVNRREAKSASDEFLSIQDAYLQDELESMGITDFDSLEEVDQQLYLWRGDITTLKVDGIVNAANSALLGCFIPNHACIDNCIHTFAGIQLRLACSQIMEEQGHPEATGQAKLTSAYNLPSSYVLHTVGPIVKGTLSQEDCDLLASSYQSCLELADEEGLKSLAFCCISTGVFGFPKQEAAEIAVKTVKDYLSQKQSSLQVVFNVFGQEDEAIYQGLLKD